MPGTATSWNVAGVTGIAVNGSTVYTADGSNVRPFDTGGNAGTSWSSAGAYSAAVDGSTPKPNPGSTKKTGGIRESRGDGKAMWDFALIGTKVVVVA